MCDLGIYVYILFGLPGLRLGVRFARNVTHAVQLEGFLGTVVVTAEKVCYPTSMAPVQFVCVQDGSLYVCGEDGEEEAIGT